MYHEKIGIFRQLLQIRERRRVHIAGEGDALVLELAAIRPRRTIAVMRGDFAHVQIAVRNDFLFRSAESNRKIFSVDRLFDAEASLVFVNSAAIEEQMQRLCRARKVSAGVRTKNMKRDRA